MVKKVCAFLVLVTLQTCWICTAYAADKSVINDDTNHLKIFTPYHTIKNVFADTSEQYSIIAKNVGIKARNKSTECKLTDDEVNLIAGVVHAESKGEPFEGKIGVASVILNRLYNPQFPKSVKEIIYQNNAFSCVKNGNIDNKPDNEAYEAVMAAIKGNDPTKNAVFFYNPRTASSSWMQAAPKNESITIGRHIFFK